MHEAEKSQVTHVKLPSLIGGGVDLIGVVEGLGVDFALVVANSFLPAPLMPAAALVCLSPLST